MVLCRHENISTVQSQPSSASLASLCPHRSNLGILPPKTTKRQHHAQLHPPISPVPVFFIFEADSRACRQNFTYGLSSTRSERVVGKVDCKVSIDCMDAVRWGWGLHSWAGGGGLLVVFGQIVYVNSSPTRRVPNLVIPMHLRFARYLVWSRGKLPESKVGTGAICI